MFSINRTTTNLNVIVLLGAVFVKEATRSSAGYEKDGLEGDLSLSCEVDVSQRILVVLLKLRGYLQKPSELRSIGYVKFPCTGAYFREGFVESRVLLFLHVFSRSLPDGLDVVHQFPVPHSLFNL